MSHRRMLSVLSLFALAACELIVDFDAENVDDRRAPVPIPSLDGARPVFVDANAIADTSVVRRPTDAGDAGDGGDAGDAGGGLSIVDAGLDAASGDAAAPSELDAAPAAAEAGDATGDLPDADLPDADANDAAASDDGALGPALGDGSPMDPSGAAAGDAA